VVGWVLWPTVYCCCFVISALNDYHDIFFPVRTCILLAGNTATHANSNVQERERVLGTRTRAKVGDDSQRRGGAEPYVCVDL
jgi:hypothetical protein